jgi:hypothetical protein
MGARQLVHQGNKVLLGRIAESDTTHDLNL